MSENIFFMTTKTRFGAKAIGLRELENGEGYELREPQNPHTPLFNPERSALSLKNNYVWQIC